MNKPHLKLTLITNAREWSALENDWRRLADTQPIVSPFMSWDWMRTWWQVFCDEQMTLRIAVCSHAGEIVGIAPFILVNEARWPLRPRRMRVMRLLGTGEPQADSVVTEYADLLIAGGYEQDVSRTIAEWLSSEADSWDVLACEWVLEASHIAQQLIPALRQLGRKDRSRSPGVRYSSRLLPSWNDYLQSVSRNIRNKLTVGRRRMKRDGRFEIVTIDQPGEMPDALLRVAELHRRRWIERGHAGSFDSPKFCEFHCVFAAAVAAQGGATVTILRLDDRDMAAMYTLHTADTSFSYQTGFDPLIAANYSPGTVVVGVDIEQAIGRGRSNYDFMCGPAGSYKERYGCETTAMAHLYSFNRTPRGYLSRLLWDLASRLEHLRRKSAPVAEADGE